MANPKQPRLVKWRGYWYVFSYDWAVGNSTRTPCSKLNAHTKTERDNLLRRMRDQHVREHAAATQVTGGTDYRLSLLKALDRYLAHVVEMAEARSANPEARFGLSTKSAADSSRIVNSLQHWLSENNLKDIRCDQITSTTLERFFAYLVSTPRTIGVQNVKRRKRSGSTINSYRNRLGTCFRWLNMQRPKLIPDFTAIQPAFKLKTVSTKPALALTPEELLIFLNASLKPLPASIVKRIKRGRKENFRQGQSRYTATPVDRLFLLLACTGMRLGEGLALKWSDLDLNSGRIVINAQKTAAWRLIPLINAPECEVAPAFLKTLKAWRKERPDSDYVLPHEGIEKPANPKYAWARVRRQSGIDLTPQKLRQNFVSYCASMGVPPAIAAMWCGHSAQVAERHYRLQLMDRKKAESIQGAMGL